MAIVANAEVIKRLVILIADGRPHPRALLRSMLSQLEVKSIHEAIDGAAALEAIVTINPGRHVCGLGTAGLQCSAGAAYGAILAHDSLSGSSGHCAFQFRPKPTRA